MFEMRKSFKCLMVGAAAAALMSPAQANDVDVKIVDGTWDTTAGFFAYVEFEFSGEPLAQGLGLNLDVLDPDQANKPDPFDFTAGILSYEFSEEAMYSVYYKSGMGPHLANGPVNMKRAGSGNPMEVLGKRVVALAAAAGQTPTDLPQNFYPITFPFPKGNPQFDGAVDVAVQATTPMKILTDKGEQKSIEAVLPAYFRDYKTLRWPDSGWDKSFSPATAGMGLMKNVLWAQDYMRQMHNVKTDTALDSVSGPDADKDPNIALGDVGADGFNGNMLIEISWDTLTMMRDSFAYDGSKLGAEIPVDYDATKSPVWFPNRISVELDQKNGVSALGATKVTDASSSLRSVWAMLWSLGEFYGFADQRTVNKNQKPEFAAVFDGDPFPAAPKENLGVGPFATKSADDPFSLVQLMTNMSSQNLLKLHFDEKNGIFLDSWADGKPGTTSTTFDAAYAVVVLQIYQRAIDALPVGYASATSGKPLGTPQGKEALKAIRSQADFILANLVNKDGLVADSYEIGKGASDTTSVLSQFAAIRAFGAAFLATGDEKYREAAKKMYLAAEKHLYDDKLALFNNKPGSPLEADPYTAGVVSGGIRELMLNLVSRSSPSDPNLALAHLAERYNTWFTKVGRGMQLAEWLNDTGEHMVSKDYDGDINQNGIKSVTYAGGPHGTAAVMATKVVFTSAK
ncbi:MAG: hypothetical protein AAGA50_11230 [Pseudomonadota bacterium]